MQETQDSAAKSSEFGNENLKKLDIELREIKTAISRPVDCNAVLAQKLNFYQQLKELISCLYSLYKHVKSYRAAFYA